MKTSTGKNAAALTPICVTASLCAAGCWPKNKGVCVQALQFTRELKLLWSATSYVLMWKNRVREQLLTQYPETLSLSLYNRFDRFNMTSMLSF
jgi:hypothetical protein